MRRRWHTGRYPSGASLGVSAPPQWESCSRVGNGVARPLGKIREREPEVGLVSTGRPRWLDRSARTSTIQALLGRSCEGILFLVSSFYRFPDP